MSDDIKPDQDSNEQPLDDKPEVSRRRFAKTGLGGGAVLMSLLSRPALGMGNNDPRCTGSILASIDAGSSLHDFDPDQCRFGCTPGFWAMKVNNKGEFSPPPTWRAWQVIGFDPMMEFSALFGCGPGPGFTDGTTLINILSIPNENDSFLKQSARHSIAAYLNATIMESFFGPTQGDIISGYCAAFQDWQASGTANDGTSLSQWHSDMAALNERNCPLDNNPQNPFYI